MGQKAHPMSFLPQVWAFCPIRDLFIKSGKTLWMDWDEIVWKDLKWYNEELT